MHDACLPSFHHGTCPRRLNFQVFTSGRFIFFYFFDFLTLDIAGMIWPSSAIFGFLTLDVVGLVLAFFSCFWLFWDFSLAVGMFNFFASCWYTGCVIYPIDRIRSD